MHFSIAIVVSGCPTVSMLTIALKSTSYQCQHTLHPSCQKCVGCFTVIPHTSAMRQHADCYNPQTPLQLLFPAQHQRLTLTSLICFVTNPITACIGTTRRSQSVHLQHGAVSSELVQMVSDHSGGLENATEMHGCHPLPHLSESVCCLMQWLHTASTSHTSVFAAGCSGLALQAQLEAGATSNKPRQML